MLKWEEEFFDRVSYYSDAITVAKDTVRANTKQDSIWWEAIAVLCKHKARILKRRGQ